MSTVVTFLLGVDVGNSVSPCDSPVVYRSHTSLRGPDGWSPFLPRGPDGRPWADREWWTSK